MFLPLAAPAAPRFVLFAHLSSSGGACGAARSQFPVHCSPNVAGAAPAAPHRLPEGGKSHIRDPPAARGGSGTAQASNLQGETAADASHAVEFEETDASRTRPEPFLPATAGTPLAGLLRTPRECGARCAVGLGEWPKRTAWVTTSYDSRCVSFSPHDSPAGGRVSPYAQFVWLLTAFCCAGLPPADRRRQAETLETPNPWMDLVFPGGDGMGGSESVVGVNGRNQYGELKDHLPRRPDAGNAELRSPRS
eukprot:gene10343-biopygen234